MRRALPMLVALWIAGSAVWASAQVTTSRGDHFNAQSSSDNPEAISVKTVRGSIRSVDPTSKTLTLTDGTTLTIPATIANAPAILRSGAMVIASYREEDARKVVTEIQIELPPMWA